MKIFLTSTLALFLVAARPQGEDAPTNRVSDGARRGGGSAAPRARHRQAQRPGEPHRALSRARRTRAGAQTACPPGGGTKQPHPARAGAAVSGSAMLAAVRPCHETLMPIFIVIRFLFL